MVRSFIRSFGSFDRRDKIKRGENLNIPLNDLMEGRGESGRGGKEKRDSIKSDESDDFII